MLGTHPTAAAPSRKAGMRLSFQCERCRRLRRHEYVYESVSGRLVWCIACHVDAFYPLGMESTR